ncbi:MAG: MBOAT family protein [Actinobacteria bacterium]|nr:MBOAT family protein [Actinomycetota bacterium]
MLFPTFEFAVFFALAFLGSWLLRPYPVRWRLFLLAASYTFYGWWDWRFTFLLAGSTLVNWTAARGIHRAGDHEGRRTRILFSAVVANLGALGFFKYYGFFVTSVAGGFSRVGLSVNPPLLQVILPIGISFYTFQALSYVIDTYRGDTEPAPFLDFAVYLSFFPHLVAGPIVRARELLPQLQGKADPRRIDAALAFRLIFAGLFKKVVVSSFISSAVVDQVFRNPGQYKNLEVLAGVYGYAIQIYADFSGYTDIAIGAALLLGLRFPQNFDAPYTARSIQDFWRRWHMTLSFWLRDYLYIPLGGNRGGERRMERNVFLTMLLGGLWHGAAWTFVAWGAIHGGAMVVERRFDQWQARRGVVATRWTPVRRWLVTFHIVCFAWIFFRAESFGLAWQVLGRLATGWGVGTLVKPMVVFTIVAMIAAQFVPSTLVERGQVLFSRTGPVVQGVTLALGFLVIDALGPTGVAPFIYFQF